MFRIEVRLITQIQNMIFTDTVTFNYINDDIAELKSRVKYLRAVFGFSKKVYVKTYEDIMAMSQYIDYELPDWIKGISFSNRIWLLDKKSWVNDIDESITNLIVHEFTHIAIFNTFKVRCPIWISEGLAVYYGRQKVNSRIIKNFNYYSADYDSDGLYSQSYYIIDFLMRKFGEASIISHAIQCDDFCNDTLFGEENIKALSDHLEDYYD